MIRVLPLVLALAAQEPSLPPAAPAGEAASAAPAAQERYEVHLWTVDQGEAVWERFGHNAIVIRDLATGQYLAWNWGLFDFDDRDFLIRFLRGSMLYSMGPVDPEALLASYVAANRTVYSNRVNLTQDEAAALDAFVRENFRPENREYVYHYFRDNCSTRVRDALDRVLGGILEDAFADRETPHSYRWHTARLVQETTWIDQGLSFLLGTRGDVPRTEWEAMFVPMELMRLVEGVERIGPSGASEPLLGPREVLYQEIGPPTPAAPPPLSAVWIVLGLALGAVVVGLGRGDPGPGRRWGLVVATVAWGLFAGALGGILVLAWFTDHDSIQRNVNLLYLSPIAAPLAAIALYAALDPRARPATAALASAIAVLSIGAALVEATPLVNQGNGEVLAVAIPVNVALAWAWRRTARRGADQPPASLTSPA